MGVRLCEELDDVIKRGALSSSRGAADEVDKEIWKMFGLLNLEISATADVIAEGDEHLRVNGGGIGLGLRFDPLSYFSQEPV
jgi:hypothetical protein